VTSMLKPNVVTLLYILLCAVNKRLLKKYSAVYVETLITSGKCSHKDLMKATEGKLLLHQAVFSNSPMLVSILVAMQEYNMNETNSAGETALHVASRTKCSIFILKKLVEDIRCDLNAQTQCGACSMCTRNANTLSP